MTAGSTAESNSLGTVSAFTTEYPADGICRVLSLDGGGSKGFYTLGVLMELEAMLGCPLHKRFDLVFGTSTGAIIAAMIGLGFEVDHIHRLYTTHVPTIMKKWTAGRKSAALAALVTEAFGKATFADMKTGVGVVATRWVLETPMIFKTGAKQAHGRVSTFVPGFGVTVANAVRASCSAYPFFKRTTVTTSAGDTVELVDGGYCANNPALYAIADAIRAFQKPPADVRLVSIGVGAYPEKKPPLGKKLYTKAVKKLTFASLVQKTLEINTQSMEQLRFVLFRDIKTVRINDTFQQPEMATDFMEHDLKKLNILRQRGRNSFADREAVLREILIP